MQIPWKRIKGTHHTGSHKTPQCQEEGIVEKEEYTPGTLRRFEVLERHVEEFIAAKYNRTDFNVKRIDHEFIDGFNFYLHTVKENDTNTANKHIKNLKKIVSICLKYKWISTDPFFGHTLKSKPVHREFLTADELQKITQKQFIPTGYRRYGTFFFSVAIPDFPMRMFKN